MPNPGSYGVNLQMTEGVALAVIALLTAVFTYLSQTDQRRSPPLQRPDEGLHAPPPSPPPLPAGKSPS